MVRPGYGSCRKSRPREPRTPKKRRRARGDLEYELNPRDTYKQPSRESWDSFREQFKKEYLAGLRERTQEKADTVLDVFEEIVKPKRLRDASTERAVSRFVTGMQEREPPLAARRAWRRSHRRTT